MRTIRPLTIFVAPLHLSSLKTQKLLDRALSRKKSENEAKRNHEYEQKL